MTATTNPKAKTLIDQNKVENISSRGKTNKLNKWLFFTCIVIALLVLALLIQTFVKGVGYLTPDFFTNFSSSTPSQAGIKGALAGTIWLMISIIPSIVLGVGERFI